MMLPVLLDAVTLAARLPASAHVRWQGRVSTGRPVLDTAGRTVDVQTALWLWLAAENLPEGHRVQAACGVALCVRPEHLCAVPTLRTATRWQRISPSVEHRPGLCSRGHDVTAAGAMRRGSGGLPVCRACHEEDTFALTLEGASARVTVSR